MKKTILSAIIGISILSMPTSVFAKDLNTIKPLENIRVEAKTGVPSLVTIQPSSSRIPRTGEIALSGYVKDSSGNPMSKKDVYLMKDGKYIDNRWTNANGYYYSPIPGQFLGIGSHNITAYVWNGTMDEEVSGKYIFHIDGHLMGFDVKSEQSASFFVGY